MFFLLVLSISDSVSSVCGRNFDHNRRDEDGGGGSTRRLPGGTSAGTSCFLNIAVTGTTEGQYDNVSGFISSTQSVLQLIRDGFPDRDRASRHRQGVLTDINSLWVALRHWRLRLPIRQLTPLNGIGFTDTLPARCDHNQRHH